MCVLSGSAVPTSAIPWTVSHQAPLPLRFPRQEYCRGMSFPSPGDLPDPGMEPVLPTLAGRIFTTGTICESWTIKKAERQRIDAFELWCWRRLLRIPWTARRLSQSILKKISPEYSLEGLMLKQKLQYFGHLMWRAHLLEKSLMLGKTEVKRRG